MTKILVNELLGADDCRPHRCIPQNRTPLEARWPSAGYRVDTHANIKVYADLGALERSWAGFRIGSGKLAWRNFDEVLVLAVNSPRALRSWLCQQIVLLAADRFPPRCDSG